MDAQDRIARLLGRHRRNQALAGAVRLGAWVVAGHILALALLGRFSLRNALSEAWLIALIASYSAYLLLPFLYLFAWRRPGNSPRAAARDLDHANPGAPDPFQTSLSMENHGEETRRELDRMFAGILPKLALPRAAFLPRPQRLALAGAALVFGAMALLSGDALGFLRRAAAPWDALANLPILRFKVEPPAPAVGIGDTLVVRGMVANRYGDQVVYAHVRTGAGERRFPLAFGPAGEKAGRTGRPGEDFEFRFGPVDGDLAVHFSADNGRSPVYRVKALALPFLESLRAVVQPPAYTRLRPDTLPPGVANFPVLPGTWVRWLARPDRPLDRVVWETRDSAGTRFDTLAPGPLAPGQEFQVSREVRRPMEYAFRLEDAQGIRSAAQVAHRIDLIPDHPPEVELIEPAQDGVLERDLKLPLAFRVKDDFGVTSLRLVWRLLSDGQVKAEGRRDGRDWLQSAASGLVEALWTMDSLELRPENVLEFHLVAVDNDTVNGPKSSRSAVRALRMPSIQEVMEASRRQEQSAMSNLKSAIQRERQLERKLERENSTPREEGPPALAGYEINRIMVDSPREHARRTRDALSMAKPTAAVKDLEEHLRKSEQALPKGDQGALPLEERRKNLDALMESQRETGKKLEELLKQAEAERKQAPGKADLPRNQIDFAAKELKRNLEAQSDLKKHFEEEAFQAKSRQDLMDQAAQEQMRMAEDMKNALEDIRKTMEQGQKNGLLNQDLLDKMQKIQELLKEVLSDSLQKLMEQKMAGQEVDAQELRDQLKKVLGKQGELGENLTRALAMLEQLRDRKRLQELRQALRELEGRERDLAKRIEGGGPEAKAGHESRLAAEQKDIQEETSRALEDFAGQAAGRKSLEQVSDQLKPEPVRKDMQEAREALAKGGKPSRPKAAGSARSAADKLAAMQSALSESLAAMENEVDIAVAHELLQESLGLSRLQLLIRAGAARRSAEGWEEDEPALYAKVAQTSGWLNERVKAFAATIPFIGSALMAEARNFHLAAQEAARQYSRDAGDKSLHYNQNLSRELLKLIKMANSGGGQGGGGSGSMSQGGGNQGNQQGPGGKSGGGGDLAGQMRGMSGKQMAINQATQQLLQAMLEGRRLSQGPGQGQQGMGGSPGGRGMGQLGPGGMPGQGGQPGGQEGQEGEGQGGESQGGEGQGGEGQGGEAQGGDGPGSRGGNGSMQGLGNRQGELGESLESLAEALSEEGGGSSRKVRKLAEEARELEEAMRQGRLGPEEVKRRQERFQSRLLEAANAMEERGMSEERKAETAKGPAKDVPESAKAGEARLIQLLREARRNSRSLRLSEAQRRLLDEYYESLLTR